MSDLLKEAIADAKTVRETAIANAKMALEEAFTPHLKSMLSAKLAEDDMEDDEDEKENPFDGEEMYGDEDEMRHAPVAVIGQEIGQPDAFIAQRDKTQHVRGADIIRAVGDKHQLARLAPGPDKEPLPLKAQLVSLDRPHASPTAYPAKAPLRPS